MKILKSRLTKLILVFFVVAFIIFILPNGKNIEKKVIVKYNNLLTLNEISPFYSFETNFNLDSKFKIKPLGIQQIFHQIWDSDLIPQYFENWLPLWKKFHPHWQHYFWSFKDVKNLIKQHYPDYLVLYESYISPIFRADVARYFILYHYGGVYVDMDMVPLKLFDNWTIHHDCVVSEEPYEHIYIVRELSKQRPTLLNGFIACKRGHPMLKLTIEMLTESARHYFGDYLHATGPYFFTRVINNYLEDKSHSDLTIVPPRYFFPTYDKSESDIVSGKCYPGRLKSLPIEGQTICRKIFQSGFKNEPTLAAYSDHHWVHSYLFGEDFKTANTISIWNISKNIKIASFLFNN